MSNLNAAVAATNDITNQGVIAMEDSKKSAIVSTMAAEMYHNGLNPVQSLVTAASFVGAMDYYDDMELFMEFFVNGLEITEVSVEGVDVDRTLDGGEVVAALVAARYLVSVTEMGERMAELLSFVTTAYAPIEYGTPWERRFGYSKVKHSPLFKESIHALEDTQYTVDDNMLSIALQVQAVLGGEKYDKEAYVLRGCVAMSSSKSYFSEFKGDSRGREYQASAHGPNGQSSDRSRALQDLVGVPTDYNVGIVKEVVRHEIMDMVTVSSKEVGKLMSLAKRDPVAFIIEQTQLKEADKPFSCSKPWSFVKAVSIWTELCAGNRPYIGMAAGFDAKCSGPQLGALMVGDQKIAAACGMTDKQMEDAYHLALAALAKAGFTNIDRDGIKKAYMGVFYGQGWMAFTDRREVEKMVWESMYGTDGVADDDTAKRFHKAIVSSFGTKMNAVRNAIKAYADKTQGRTKHKMPDGFEVAMNYKHHVNILGEVMDYETEDYDVYVRNNAEQYKFINFQLRTKDTHVGDFARNGFVNLIQATDALIARLIIVHLKRLGAKHIISVHDCFRVNVTETHLLTQAIKSAYMELFGAPKLTKNEDLPLGTDILGLYFEGANKQLVEDAKPTMISQFTKGGLRYLQKINGARVRNLIMLLGDGAYYFAK